MTTSYGDNASPQCLSPRETVDEPLRVSFLRALAALLALVPGVGDVHLGTEQSLRDVANGQDRRRVHKLQICRGWPDRRSDLELICQWADALGIEFVVARPCTGQFAVSVYGEIGGHPVEVWTVFDELRGSDIPTGTEIPISVLRDAELHVSGGLSTALAHLGYPSAPAAVGSEVTR